MSNIELYHLLVETTLLQQQLANADSYYVASLTRKDTTTSSKSISMRSNPAYGEAIRKGIVTTANIKLVIVQPNLAYVGNEVNTARLKSESLV